MSTSHPDGRTAFFYGTLMAPEVLHRVCHGSSSPDNPIFATHNLKTYAAILPSHQRHRVKGADYPAILPHPTSTVRLLATDSVRERSPRLPRLSSISESRLN